MCATCGCGDEGVATIDGGHAHEHEHRHAHEHAHADGRVHSHEHRHRHTHAHGHDAAEPPPDHGHPHAHDGAADGHRPPGEHDHGHPHEHGGGHPGDHVSDEDPAHHHHPGSDADPERADPHPPGPARAGRPDRWIALEQEVLAKNDQLAAENRAWLQARQVLALNLLSSPGAGKTTLLEATIRALHGELVFSVVEGDQETALDAERIRATGAPAVQVNTGSGCHLDAAMIAGCLPRLRPPASSVLLIENVGNLVCPALFDLGERAKVVIVSVTEGEDKPLKYPHVFRASELMVLNKVDLVPHLSFDPGRCITNARKVNPRLEVISVSATRGDGLPEWFGWIRRRLTA